MGRAGRVDNHLPASSRTCATRTTAGATVWFGALRVGVAPASAAQMPQVRAARGAVGAVICAAAAPEVEAAGFDTAAAVLNSATAERCWMVRWRTAGIGRCLVWVAVAAATGLARTAGASGAFPSDPRCGRSVCRTGVLGSAERPAETLGAAASSSAAATPIPGPANDSPRATAAAPTCTPLFNALTGETY